MGGGDYSSGLGLVWGDFTERGEFGNRSGVVEDLEEVFGWGNGTKVLKGKLWNRDWEWSRLRRFGGHPEVRRFCFYARLTLPEPGATTVSGHSPHFLQEVYSIAQETLK